MNEAMDELHPDGPAQRWLDATFDALTGTGAHGRRVLAEVEDHLHTAVSDGLSRGLTREQAEQEAVTRLGSPATLARGIRRAHRNLRPWLTGGWLLAGAVTLGLGISVSTTALLEGILERNTFGNNPLRLGVEGLTVLGVGLLLLVGFRLARRYTGMRSPQWMPRRRILVVSAVCLAIVGVGVLGNPYNNLGVRQFSYYTWPVPLGLAVLTAALALAATVLLTGLRPRPTPQY